MISGMFGHSNPGMHLVFMDFSQGSHSAVDLFRLPLGLVAIHCRSEGLLRTDPQRFVWRMRGKGETAGIRRIGEVKTAIGTRLRHHSLGGCVKRHLNGLIFE